MSPRHPTAVIHSATRIPEDVAIGAYAVIEDGVEIGSGTIIREQVVIRTGTVMGERCQVDAGTVLGGLPQDLSFDPRTPSGVRIGHDVVLREGVTVNRATGEGTFTEVGAGSFLMAHSHVGHDCRVGEAVVLANGVLLAGKVSVGSHAFIGGNAAVHQYCRIGESAMVGGMARVSQDVPPFCMMSERNELIGLNLVGLRRRGLDREVIRDLKHLYRLVFGFEGRPRLLAQATLADRLSRTAEGTAFLQFIAEESSRGVIRPRAAKE